jgi:hypothetical protein
VHGVLIAGAGGLSRSPSQHYAAHFTGISAPLGQFATAFVDGALATPIGTVDALPIEESPDYARVGLVDVALFEKRCYVVALWARSAQDLVASPNNRDSRGAPTLLAAVRVGGGWQVHNCYLTMVSWDRDRLFRGDYPPA